MLDHERLLDGGYTAAEIVKAEELDREAEAAGFLGYDDEAEVYFPGRPADESDDEDLPF
jgi:hypothetical protein